MCALQRLIAPVKRQTISTRSIPIPSRCRAQHTSQTPLLYLRSSQNIRRAAYKQPTSPFLRCYATAEAGPPSQPLPHKPAPHNRNPDEPIYQLTFTCKACGHRSSHTVSKQGYHKGTVLISCPGCKNRHLISDHLHIFSDKSVTLEDIMKSKGESVKRGSIDMEGDVEFWADEGVKDNTNSEKDETVQ